MALNFNTLLEGYKKKLSEGVQQGLSNVRGNLNTLSTNINMVRTNPKFAQQLPQMVGYGIKDLTSEASRSLPKPLQKPMSIAGNVTGNITQGFTGLLSAPFTNQTPYQKLSNVAEGIGQVALPGKTLGFATIGTGFNALGNMVTQRRLPTLDELGQEFNKQQMESGKTALIYELTGKALKGPFDKIFGPTLRNANQFISQGIRLGGPILQNPYYRAVAKRLVIDIVRSGQELGIPSAILGFIDSDKQNFEDRLVEGLHSYVSGVGQGMAFKTGEQTLKIAPKQFLDRVIKPAIDKYRALTPQQQQGGYLKPDEFFPEYGKSQYKNIAQDDLNRTRNIIMKKLSNPNLSLTEQNQYRKVLGTIEDKIFQLQGDVKTAELAGGGRAKGGEVSKLSKPSVQGSLQDMPSLGQKKIGLKTKIPLKDIIVEESGPVPQTASRTKGAVEVVQDEVTGKYHLFDGQHRVSEALKRGESDIEALVAKGEPVQGGGWNIKPNTPQVTKGSLPQQTGEATAGLKPSAISKLEGLAKPQISVPRIVKKQVSQGENIVQKAEKVRQEALQSGKITQDVPSLPDIVRSWDIDVKSKVGIFDYLRTPDRVLKKIGLEKEINLLRTQYDKYLKKLPVEINKITDWSKRVSPQSNQRIFQYLDGKPVQLDQNELKVAGEIKDYLSEWATKLKLPADKRISHYITHIFEKDFIKKEFDPDFAKLIQNKVPGSVYDPFLEQRLGKLGFVEDTWRALDAYVKRATRKYNIDVALEPIKKRA